jgi:ornithine cyclodeaminase
MKFFNEEDTHAGLPYSRLVTALIEAHKRDIHARGSSILEERTQHLVNNFLALPAWQHGRAFGAKLVSSFPGNLKMPDSLPSVQGVYVLFDGRDGRTVAVIDGIALTLRKTAADSALGTHFLARENAQTLLLVGAGALAPHLIMAHCAARTSIQKVVVWNRTPERAASVAKSLNMKDIEITATTDLESAARVSDVISCATGATDPLIRGEWLKEGAHLDLVGSFRPDMHECDQAAIRRAAVFADSRWSALQDCGEIVTALASGALTPEDIRADAFQLARGEHPGRTSDDEITLYKNGGGGHLDLMVAQILCPVDSAIPE